MLPDSQHAKLEIFCKLKLEVSVKESGGRGGRREPKIFTQEEKIHKRANEQSLKRRQEKICSQL